MEGAGGVGMRNKKFSRSGGAAEEGDQLALFDCFISSRWR